MVGMEYLFFISLSLLPVVKGFIAIIWMRNYTKIIIINNNKNVK